MATAVAKSVVFVTTPVAIVYRPPVPSIDPLLESMGFITAAWRPASLEKHDQSGRSIFHRYRVFFYFSLCRISTTKVVKE